MITTTRVPVLNSWQLAYVTNAASSEISKDTKPVHVLLLLG